MEFERGVGDGDRSLWEENIGRMAEKNSREEYWENDRDVEIEKMEVRKRKVGKATEERSIYLASVEN